MTSSNRINLQCNFESGGWQKQKREELKLKRNVIKMKA